MARFHLCCAIPRRSNDTKKSRCRCRTQNRVSKAGSDGIVPRSAFSLSPKWRNGRDRNAFILLLLLLSRLVWTLKSLSTFEANVINDSARTASLYAARIESLSRSQFKFCYLSRKFFCYDTFVIAMGINIDLRSLDVIPPHPKFT